MAKRRLDIAAARRRGQPAGAAVLRFAPSPTGRVHLGTALSALFTCEAARALGGRFLLRIENTDTTRARDEFETALLEDLAWLGLEWERPVRRQSEHMADYGAALDRLAERGLLYPCYASRSELAAAAQGAGGGWPRDPDGTPLHPGRGRAISAEIERARAAAGEAPALRLDMAKALDEVRAGTLGFREIGAWAPRTGRVAADPAKWGDVVIARKDIATSYHLSVVVDDALQGVSHVTRGLDLYEATHIHRLLQALLGLPTPVYCHHPLILDDAGGKLGKSAGAKALAALRADGATPADIRAMVGMDRFADFLTGLTPATPVGSSGAR
jgi:glutamyl-Q tRNA(Asp) synthetase